LQTAEELQCGKLNAVADLEVPAEKINKALRRLETGSALSTSAFATLIFWLLPTLYVAIFPFPGYSPPPLWIWVFLISLILLAVIGWVVGVLIFRSSCMGKVGWVTALASFHLYGTLVAASGVAAIVAVLWAYAVLNTSPPHVPILEVGASGLVVAASRVAWRWLYGRAKATIAPLQRECAARLAREGSPTS
jgi:hypothetical protein